MIALKDIIDFLKPIDVIGSTERLISKPTQLGAKNVGDDMILWVSEKNSSKLRDITSGTIICKSVEDRSINKTCTYLVVENPRNSFRRLLGQFFSAPKIFKIADSAKISKDAVLGKDLFIGEHVVIEEGCSIGDSTIIDHNTVIKRNSIIGNNVKIGSNNVIGSVGFGYERDEDGIYQPIPHIGNVIIEDYSEIGNCVTIDRAVMGSTKIEKHSKIDNLVHIAHGVRIGENSLIIANAMIAGSVDIGKNVWVAPSSSVLNKVTIDDNAVIGMSAVVLKNVNKNEVIVGNPGKVLNKK